ncbi:MAG: hypothetical protein HY327_01225 [Chloroflexi bacterium]|nr:hypothetical protein [Chloroflexota bacterium]
MSFEILEIDDAVSHLVGGEGIHQAENQTEKFTSYIFIGVDRDIQPGRVSH